MPKEGPDLQTLPISQLTPNRWNPNVMTDAEFAQLVAEVRRLGRLPKPIVVRALDDGTYEIIDGEHGWRAAKEAGLEHVLCELVEIDTFQAMRQTLVRNRHGNHDSIRQALVYRAMMQERRLPARQLAEELDVSEGTIRNALIYLDAVNLRNRYAAAELEADGLPVTPADAIIRNKSIRQIRVYLDLPDGIRNTWLNAGADIRAVSEYQDDLCDEDDPKYPRLEQLGSTALCKGVSMQRGQFRSSLRLCLRLLDTYVRQDYIPDLDYYLLAIAIYNLDPSVVEALPIDPTGPTLLLDLATWDAIMSLTASCELSSPAPQVDYARAQVHAALDRAGIDKTRAFDPKTIEQHRIVAQGPDSIRDAPFLTLKEKVELIQYAPKYPDDVVIEAKRRTCEELRRRRVERKGLWRGCPTMICSNILDDMHGGVSLADLQELAADHSAAVENVADYFSFTWQNRVVGERPAEAVFREWLTQMETPALVMIAGVLAGVDKDVIATAWLSTVGGRTIERKPRRVDGAGHATPCSP